MTIINKNLRSAVKTITCIIMILIVFSCYGRIDCPAYPEKYLNWLPYEEDETYFFTNGTDTINFNVNKVDITHVYRMVKYPKSKCDCNANIETETSTVGGYPKFTFSSMYGESLNEKVISYCYSI
jgi:hypothetical protein